MNLHLHMLLHTSPYCSIPELGMGIMMEQGLKESPYQVWTLLWRFGNSPYRVWSLRGIIRYVPVHQKSRNLTLVHTRVQFVGLPRRYVVCTSTYRYIQVHTNIGIIGQVPGPLSRARQHGVLVLDFKITTNSITYWTAKSSLFSNCIHFPPFLSAPRPTPNISHCLKKKNHRRGVRHEMVEIYAESYSAAVSCMLCSNKYRSYDFIMMIV